VRRSCVQAAVRALIVPPLDTWLLFCLACMALVATPGPSILYLVSRTLAQGRAAGFVSLCGTSSGFALHALAAAFGLSALLAAVPLAYEAVRWLGAAYLAWLAVATWRARNDAAPEAVSREIPVVQLFRQGLLTAVLNPKVALFQLAFFPQFITPANGSVLTQSLVLAATQLAIVVAGDSMFVLAAASVRRWFSLRPGWGRWSRRALAGVFGALAARLVWQDRP
jgi:threonine/homoserine/homoserine lactone efflux protein